VVVNRHRFALVAIGDRQPLLDVNGLVGTQSSRAQTLIHLRAPLSQVLIQMVPNISRTKEGRFCGDRRRTMNKDQVLGKVKQAAGKVKQSIGEALGNEKLANQGVVDQAKGAGMEMWGKARDAAKGVQQSRKNAATDQAHERRNKISQSVQNAKEKASERIDEFKERHSA